MNKLNKKGGTKMNLGIISTVFEFLGVSATSIFAVTLLIRWSNMGNKNVKHTNKSNSKSNVKKIA